MDRESLGRVPDNYVLPRVLWDASVILMIDSGHGLIENVWVHIYFPLSSYLDQARAPTPDTAAWSCIWERESEAGGTCLYWVMSQQFGVNTEKGVILWNAPEKWHMTSLVVHVTHLKNGTSPSSSEALGSVREVTGTESKCMGFRALSFCDFFGKITSKWCLCQLLRT